MNVRLLGRDTGNTGYLLNQYTLLTLQSNIFLAGRTSDYTILKVGRTQNGFHVHAT